MDISLCYLFENNTLTSMSCFDHNDFNFTNLKAARDTGLLKEAKDKLEKQLEELTWRLQLEKRLRVNYLALN